MGSFGKMPLLGRLIFFLCVGLMTASSTDLLRAATTLPLIGLFTDYGWDDPYVAQLKGSIVTIAPRVQILDLIHSVTPFSVAEGAYLLDQSAAEFPAGTIFVAVVDPQVGTERDPILLETAKGKFYVGRDNGLFTDVINREGFSGAWKLDRPEFFRDDDPSRTFHGRDIFGPVAAHLASGTDPEKLGTPLKSISMLPTRDPMLAGGTISAEVQHVDRFGNVILNVPEGSDVSANLKEGNLVKIQVGRESFSGPLVKTYGEVAKGRLLLLYGSGGLLEISVNQGSAAKMLKVESGTAIFLKP
jgi:S-adenosylmethionine hydrolase